MAGLINKQTKNSVRFARAEDELIVKLANEGNTAKEISQALGEAGYNRTPSSVQYRIGAKLSKVDSLDEITYK